MYYESELYHHGVKGMKWGVRKQRKQAKKDAKEYARAKMFYGEGAGTRRKLINNTVKQRSKDLTYKKAFDEALSKQDMAKHAVKARGERKRKDVASAAGRIGRGVVNIVIGHPERLGAGMAAKRTGADKVIKKYAKKTVSSVRNAASTYAARRTVEKMFKNAKVV